VEVETGGTYDVVLYYACPASDVGASFELAWNESRISGQVTAAHDPPLIGPEDDRVKRIEGFVKDFKTLSVGKIELGQGRGKLTLRALDIPGKQVMELRYVVLTLASTR
jgi:hypothetical protein